MAPVLQPYFEKTYRTDGKGYFSNWSERHIAYAAGLGTFSLSDGFIIERGIAHRLRQCRHQYYAACQPEDS